MAQILVEIKLVSIYLEYINDLLWCDTESTCRGCFC